MIRADGVNGLIVFAGWQVSTSFEFDIDNKLLILMS